MREEDQERILIEVVSRVVHQTVQGSENGRLRLDEVLADTLYHELRRLKEEPDTRTSQGDLAFYKEVRRRLPRASDASHQKSIEQVVRRYAEEISGNFDERVYKAVSRVGAPALGVLLNAVSPKMLVQRFPAVPSIDEAVVIQGETEHLRRLHELGTVILLPTHVSNLDSVLIGFALFRLGLPPFIYGAGLNLFSNPLLGFFMNNLGAYTVDRKKRDPLYKATLKEYAGLTLEHGYDNIFFPGGTRSRAGAIETRLKLGLLGTGVSAYVHNLQRKKAAPKIFIVPCTLGFQLVLEAETLIDDFLKDVGKSRYIITDDEFSKPKRVLDFLKQLIGLDSKMYFTLGRGFDPFGNPVDDDGESLDPCGRHVETERYVLKNGEPVHDAQRDAEYTREVGNQVAEAFVKDNVIQATNVTARAVFSVLRKQNPNFNVVRLIRSTAPNEDMALTDVYDEAERILRQLRGLASRGGIRLGPIVDHGSVDEVVADGLRHFAIYHEEAAATRRGDRVFPTSKGLLFYYQNRLEGYRLEREDGLEPLLTDDHRSIRGL